MADETVFQKIAGCVGNYAPGIAAILAATGVGAPVAAAVAAVGALAKSFGLPETATHDDVLSAIQVADPETKVKIIAAENAYQLSVMGLQLQTYQAGLTDVQNARGREVDTTKATGKRDVNMFVLAWVIIGGFFGTIISIIAMKVLAPTVSLAADPMLSLLLGSLSTDAGMVVGYFFGSSRGSDTKTDMIYNSTQNLPKKDVS